MFSKGYDEVDSMEWEAKDFLIDQTGSQSRVFTFSIQFRHLPDNQTRWQLVDGVVLADGRVMINREEYLRTLAADSGLEEAGFAEQLSRWVEAQVQPANVEAA